MLSTKQMHFAQKISMNFYSFDFQLCIGRIMNHWQLQCNYLLMTMTLHIIFLIIFFINGHQACFSTGSVNQNQNQNQNQTGSSPVPISHDYIVQVFPTASPDEKLTEDCVCGVSNVKIVGGEAAERWEFPWQVALVR